MFRYHDALGAKILLFLGEVGGTGVLALHVVWLLRFNWVMRAPRPEVTWKPLLPKTRT